jgi:hypothetical protein
MFNIIGAKAGAAKWPIELSIPISKADKQMNTIKGNIIRTSLIARAFWVTSKPGAIALMINGAMITPKIVIKTKRTKVRLKMELANFQGSFLFTRCSVNTGMKDTDSAPSPKILRKRLGITKARKKTSLAKGANMAPITISRIKPNTRLVIVPKLTVLADLANPSCVTI